MAAKKNSKKNNNKRALDVENACLTAEEIKFAMEIDVEEKPLNTMADLKIFMPTVEQMVMDDDINNVLADFGEDLIIASDAAEHFRLGLEWKENARVQMATVVAKAKAEMDHFATELEAVKHDIERKEKASRDQFFNDPRIQEALSLLKDNKEKWDALRIRIEKNVTNVCSSKLEDLYKQRNDLAELVKVATADHKAAYELANEYGKNGANEFAIRNELLRANGFTVKEVTSKK